MAVSDRRARTPDVRVDFHPPDVNLELHPPDVTVEFHPPTPGDVQVTHDPATDTWKSKRLSNGEPAKASLINNDPRKPQKASVVARTSGNPVNASLTATINNQKEIAPPAPSRVPVVSLAVPGAQVPFIPPTWYHGIDSLPDQHTPPPKLCLRCSIEDELQRRDVATARQFPVFVRDPIPGEFPDPEKPAPLVTVEPGPSEGAASMSVWAAEDKGKGAPTFEYVLVDFPDGKYRHRPVWTDKRLAQGYIGVLTFPR